MDAFEQCVNDPSTGIRWSEYDEKTLKDKDLLRSKVSSDIWSNSLNVKICANDLDQSKSALYQYAYTQRGHRLSF